MLQRTMQAGNGVAGDLRFVQSAGATTMRMRSLLPGS